MVQYIIYLFGLDFWSSGRVRRSHAIELRPLSGNSLECNGYEFRPQGDKRCVPRRCCFRETAMLTVLDAVVPAQVTWT